MATKLEIFEKLQQDILMWHGVGVQSAAVAERTQVREDGSEETKNGYHGEENFN